MTLPLLADGHALVAVDRMRSMLDALEGKLSTLAQVERASSTARLQLVVADIRELPLADASADLVIAPFNTIQHLYTSEQLLRCFREIARVLVPGGTFAFDVMLPDLDWLLWPDDRRHAITEFVHPTSGEHTFYSTNHTYDHHTQVCHIRIYYDARSAYGAPLDIDAPPRETVHLAHRQIFPEELRALLPAAGLGLDRLGGDFRDLRLTAEVESMVAVGRKLAAP